MKEKLRLKKSRPIWIFLIIALLILAFIVPCVIALLSPNHASEIKSILSDYAKDERYVIVYNDAYLKFNDHELNLYNLEKWYQFDKMHCFIDDSWIYFSGTDDDNSDYCSVKLFKCDHYGESFSVVFEKDYPKNSVNDYGDAFMNAKVITHQDCCLQGYNFYIKHHSGKKEDKNLYALDVYNIENGEFKTILYGEEAYNFQVEVNIYNPPNADNEVIGGDLVFENELASKLKKYGLTYLRTYYRNDEQYAFCNIWTTTDLFNIYFRYNEQTGQFDYITWTNGGGEFPSDILKTKD